MRPIALGSSILVAALLPNVGNPQILYRPTAPPSVDAAAAPWRMSGEPIFYAGSYYYPTGPSVFFDGKVMSQVGEYRGVPFYADVTLEPYSIVFVPIGRSLMKPYERPRRGDLAGTVGSRTPSWPVEVPSGAPAQARRSPGTQAPVAPGSPAVTPSAITPQPIATSGLLQCVPCAPVGTTTSAAPPAATPTIAQTIPPPSRNDGITVTFDSRRWFSSGPSVSYSPDRFVQVGDLGGFPVYRQQSGSSPGTIYVTVVPGGPVAPYSVR
jgi:hypothetical protein